MAGFKWLKDTMQYLWNGAKRIFSPSDDDYPNTGVQPYKDEPLDEGKRKSW
ncbi:MAG: isochorismate synthase [Cyanobacteriota bacterium]|nr:isochorismate synthase [Cyanobacteriota bacterium]